VDARIWEGGRGECLHSWARFLDVNSAASWDALRYLGVSFLATDLAVARRRAGVFRCIHCPGCAGLSGWLYVLGVSFAGVGGGWRGQEAAWDSKTPRLVCGITGACERYLGMGIRGEYNDLNSLSSSPAQRVW